jgi:hypothetical protein
MTKNLYEPRPGMYNSGKFGSPKEPVAGMILGPMDGSLEIKLWLEIYLAVGQNRPRTLDMPLGGNGRSKTYKCSCMACPFEVHVTKANGLWSVASATTEHKLGVCTSFGVAGAKLQAYLNYDHTLVHGTKPIKLLRHTNSLGLHSGTKFENLGNVTKGYQKPTGYNCAFRASQILNQVSVDSFVTGFDLLPDYLRKTLDLNPNSVIKLDTKTTTADDGSTHKQFFRMFLMTDSQATLMANCKPIISYDGAYTKVNRFIDIIFRSFKIVSNRLFNGADIKFCCLVVVTERERTVLPVLHLFQLKME